MVCPYENAQDAGQHLNATVVMYDDRPYYVREVIDLRGVLTAQLAALPRVRDEINVSIFDPLFDAKGMGQRLGYMNSQSRGVVYLSRIPSKQYKQGLSQGNLHIPRVNGNRVYDFPSLIQNTYFAAMIRREYPSFKQTILDLRATPTLRSQAFAPEFALEIDELGYFLLHFKGERVAWGDPTSLKLPSHFSYLKEMLNKYGVPFDA